MTRAHRHFELYLFTRKFSFILQIETFLGNCNSVSLSLLSCSNHIFWLNAFVPHSFVVKNQYPPKCNLNARTVLMVIRKTEEKIK